MRVKKVRNKKMGEEAQRVEWAGSARMLASEAQKKKECKKWTGKSFSP